MSAKSTTTEPNEAGSVNGRPRSKGVKASPLRVLQGGRTSNRSRRPRRQAVAVAPNLCLECRLSHAPGDVRNRIALDVVAGELGVDVDTVAKYVARARAGRMRFPLPVTPPKSRMLFDACAIARHRHQLRAPMERAVSIEAERVRREHEGAIRKAFVANAALDVQLERLAFELRMKAKREHRKHLIALYKQMCVDEGEFRRGLRALEQEIGDLSEHQR